MNVNSKALTKEQRDGVVTALRDFHGPVMKKVSSKNAYFFPKVPYLTSNGIKVVGLFRSELERMDEDVFIELISMNYEPLDSKRTLYRHRFNPHFREEYERAPGNTMDRYNVPVDELEVVWKQPDTPAAVPVDVDSVEDNHLSQMTIRDVAAILLKKPVSTKAWLNTLISQQ